MHELDFVCESVAFQLGRTGSAFSQTDAAMMRALEGSSGQALAVWPDKPYPVALNGADGVKYLKPKAVDRLVKVAGALRGIQARHPDFGFIVDMQDRRIRALAEPGEPVFPSFTFNRMKGDRHRILWPLAGYHDFGAGGFVDAVHPDAVPWEDKAPRVVWRGITGGRASGEGPGRGEGARLKTAIRKFEQGRMTRDQLQQIVGELPRYNAVRSLKDDPRFDFGFVDGDGYVIAETPLHEDLGKPRLTRHEMQGYRYIAVLRGLDVGSSFYWAMNSGSVALVMDTPFETFASAHFRAWEHYIPFREDLSDLINHLDWAESHPSECREMVARSTEMCRYLARGDLRRLICDEVIASLGEMIGDLVPELPMVPVTGFPGQRGARAEALPLP